MEWMRNERRSNGLNMDTLRDWEVEHGYNRPYYTELPRQYTSTRLADSNMKFIRDTSHHQPRRGMRRSVNTIHVASHHNWPRAARIATVDVEEATLEVMAWQHTYRLPS